jgi:hypothetical protein
VRVSMPSAGIECTQQDDSMCPEFSTVGRQGNEHTQPFFVSSAADVLQLVIV